MQLGCLDKILISSHAMLKYGYFVIFPYRDFFNNDKILPSFYFSIFSSFFFRLTSRLKLDDILVRSEALFFKYCRKSVADCFHVIDTPSAYERKLQKRWKCKQKEFADSFHVMDTSTAYERNLQKRWKHQRKSVADCFHVMNTSTAYERKLQKRWKYIQKNLQIVFMLWTHQQHMNESYKNGENVNKNQWQLVFVL